MSRIETGRAMRLGEIQQAVSAETGVSAPDGDALPQISESRALVPLAPTAPRREPLPRFRQAPFLAQLLAAKDLHPQACGRRRAAPDEAIAAYRDGAALTSR
jgi:hypothetical protein